MDTSRHKRFFNEVKVFQILFTKTSKKRFYSIKHEVPSQNQFPRSHLNYFTKCLEKNIYPKNVDIKSEHFNIAFATNDIKKSLCQLDICIFFVFFSFLYFSFVYFSFAYFSFAYFSFEYFFFTCKLFFYSETFYSHTFHSYTSKQSS